MNVHFCFLATCLFWFPQTNAQEKSLDVLPANRERIQAQFCITTENTSCTQDYLEGQIFPVLEKYIKRLPVDTLELRLKFTVTPEGKRDRTEIAMNLGKSALSQKIERKLDRALQTAEPFRVSNYNDGAYPSWHRFESHYAVLKRENLLKPLERPETYTAGVVLQVPRFPDCPAEGDLEDRRCFQKHMQNHIKAHFKYPVAALKNGIQGVVYAMFTIDEYGEINSLRMKGPNPLLTAEAARIISLLPRFHPALEDGKPVSIPFSIPIGFKLTTTN